MPPSLPAAAFENVTFWDARYSVDDEAFDWYEAPSIGITMAAIDRALSVSTAAASAATSTPTSTPSPVFSLLDIGCGTSLLAERIAEERSHLFNRIVACDASEVAIEKQRQRQEERRRRRAEEERGGEQPGNGSSSSTRAATIAAVSYEVADAFILPYGDSSFDAVVDKGTADALDCGGCDDDEEGERGREREIDAREAGDGPPPFAFSFSFLSFFFPPSCCSSHRRGDQGHQARRDLRDGLVQGPAEKKERLRDSGEAAFGGGCRKRQVPLSSFFVPFVDRRGDQ